MVGWLRAAAVVFMAVAAGVAVATLHNGASAWRLASRGVERPAVVGGDGIVRISVDADGMAVTARCAGCEADAKPGDAVRVRFDRDDTSLVEAADGHTYLGRTVLGLILLAGLLGAGLMAISRATRISSRTSPRRGSRYP